MWCINPLSLFNSGLHLNASGVDLGPSGSLDGICFFNSLNIIIVIPTNKEATRQVLSVPSINSTMIIEPSPIPLRGLPPSGLFFFDC